MKKLLVFLFLFFSPTSFLFSQENFERAGIVLRNAYDSVLTEMRDRTVGSWAEAVKDSVVSNGEREDFAELVSSFKQKKDGFDAKLNFYGVKTTIEIPRQRRSLPLTTSVTVVAEGRRKQAMFDRLLAVEMENISSAVREAAENDVVSKGELASLQDLFEQFQGDKEEYDGILKEMGNETTVKLSSQLCKIEEGVKKYFVPSGLYQDDGALRRAVVEVVGRDVRIRDGRESPLMMYLASGPLLPLILVYDLVNGHLW